MISRDLWLSASFFPALFIEKKKEWDLSRTGGPEKNVSRDHRMKRDVRRLIAYIKRERQRNQKVRRVYYNSCEWSTTNRSKMVRVLDNRSPHFYTRHPVNPSTMVRFLFSYCPPCPRVSGRAFSVRPSIANPFSPDRPWSIPCRRLCSACLSVTECDEQRFLID